MNNIKKIKLIVGGGPIIFIGSMNAMPMMYALELKKKGYEVIYFVDAPASDNLSRPENHFSDIEYPYPDWIIEVDIKTQMLLPFFRKYFAEFLDAKANKIINTPPQAYVLNGFFISLVPSLQEDVPKIALSHGSDLDSWADTDGVEVLSDGFRGYSIFKYVPKFLAKKLIKKAVLRQFNGFESADKVVYFPYGFNSNGDRVVDKLRRRGVACYERYDISFEPLKNQSRNCKETGDKLVVFSGVRFTYDTFSEGNLEYSKGNDLIIKGLAKFYQDHKELVVHFVEKGPDVEKAKLLCKETGLESAVVWHKEMKFTELLELYEQSDVCFDQVGQHWIGAIGGYALWLGKPLIANDNLPVEVGLWPKDNPVCSAGSAENVYEWLCMLKNAECRKEISEKSKAFVECYMAPSKLVSDIFEFEVNA